MLAFAKVNGHQYYIDEQGILFRANGTKSVTVKITSPIIKKILKRLVKTMVDKEERYTFTIRQLRNQINEINELLDKKLSELRDLKANIEDKVGK